MMDELVERIAGLEALALFEGRGLHSSTFQLNQSRCRSNNPIYTSTHLRLITCQHSAGAYTRDSYTSQLNLSRFRSQKSHQASTSRLNL